MARKPFEKAQYDWAIKHREALGPEAFEKIVGILRTENPEALTEKKKGRPRQLADDIFLGPRFNDDLFYYDEDNWEYILNLIEIFLRETSRLFKDTAKGWARLATMWNKCGFILLNNWGEVNIPEESLYGHYKALYEFIKENKDFEKEPSYGEFCKAINDIEQIEVEYPKEEREMDEERINQAFLESIKKLREDWRWEDWDGYPD